VNRIARALLLPIDLAIAIAAAVLLAPVCLGPRRWGIRVARGYGRIAAAFDPHARRVAAINLRRAYGSALSRADARRVAWRVFANMAQSLAEGLQLVRDLRLSAAPPTAYDIEDPALDRRICLDPRPKVFVTGHLGSWEVMTITAALRHGGPGAVIARRVDNPFVDWLFQRLRAPAGAEILEKRGAATTAMARLRSGTNVAMLMDENAGRRGVFVEFFGRPASTSRLPALLSLASGSPLVLGVAVRARDRVGADLRIRLALFEPGDYRAAHDESAGVRGMTQAVMRQYEQWVRDDPWQWRWIHWRWKTRPDGREETYSRHDLEACFAEPGNRSSRRGAPRLSGTPTATD
jgi:KDO2-lipid IV(A) lauroyltransferase